MSDDISPYWNNRAASIGMPVDALGFTYDTFDYIRGRQANLPGDVLEPVSSKHVTAAEFSAAFIQLAKEKFGDDYAAALNSWGLETSEKLGATVFALVDRNLIGKQDSDQQSEFDGHFDFSSSASGAKNIAAYSYTSNNWPAGPFLPAPHRPRNLAVVLVLVVAAMGILTVGEIFSEYTKPIPVLFVVYALCIGAVLISAWVRQRPQFSFHSMMLAVTAVALILGLIKWLEG